MNAIKIKTVKDFIGKEIYLYEKYQLSQIKSLETETLIIVDAFELEKIYKRGEQIEHVYLVVLQLLSKEEDYPLRLEVEKQYAFSKDFLEGVIETYDELNICNLFYGGTTPWFRREKFSSCGEIGSIYEWYVMPTLSFNKDKLPK